jgi:RNA polymerase sigma-70 factor (ECF subfamily)
MGAWSMGGVPANPSAWITRVAMNLARDAMRHHRMSSGKEQAIVTHCEQMQANPSTALDGPQEIRDDALRLMFVCCHPAVTVDAQVVMALKILCGFSTAEIARAFLSSESAIEKQLTRTKQRIREARIEFDLPERGDLSPRLDGVLAALYLLFNEGYKASSGDRLLREDLSREAIRMTSLLVEHPAGRTPRSHALLALMLLSASRFPSRVNDQGLLLRLEDQDRSKWDQSLMNRGFHHLTLAAQGSELSEYHLLAGIAALHCTAPDFSATDWNGILRHYDELDRIKPSPVIALNRAVAVANVHGPRAGLDAIEQTAHRDKVESNHLFHAVAGELHWRLGNHQEAAASFRRALKLAEVGPEQDFLTRILARVEEVA